MYVRSGAFELADGETNGHNPQRDQISPVDGQRSRSDIVQGADEKTGVRCSYSSTRVESGIRTSLTKRWFTN